LNSIKKHILKKPDCNCGKTQEIWELSFSLDIKHLQVFIDNNFISNKSYEKNGILYVEQDAILAIGPYGSNRLQIKCKKTPCDEGMDLLESILKSL
jgi:hypothetical protein